MFSHLILTCIICFSYFLESIFGFGGALIALVGLGFFYDFKEIIPIVLYAGIVSSIIIILTDRKNFAKDVFKVNFLPIFLGLIVGVFIFYFASALILMNIYAFFLLYNSLKNLYKGEFILSKFNKKIYLFIGGIIHGIFGTGGPVILLAIKDEFRNKSELRITMSHYFLILNILKIFQLYFFTEFPIIEIFAKWWLILPLSISIFIGYKIHVKISESLFKYVISFLLLIASIIFIVK